MTLSGGTFTLDCRDDALHSNGDLTISGGSFDLSAGDDGAHADGALAVSGGEITVRTCHEGLEGATVDVSGGTIDITANDDGLNAADGSDSTYTDPFGGGNDSCVITISGGVLNIDAGGDGLDSNGSLYVTGGEVYVSGSTGDGDSALDYNGSASVTGGIVVAAGMRGMAQNFGADSTQGSILLSFGQSPSRSRTATARSSPPTRPRRPMTVSSSARPA